jgi:PadR family transcriptional regulator, regulatory protein PadR
VTRSRQPSPQTAAVLSTLAREPTTWRYGYDLCQEVGLKAGSMYPILMRLADRGLLEATWATETESGRPPRHLYRLTGTGLAVAARLTAAPAAPGTRAASTAAASTVSGSRLAGEHP